MYSLTNSGETSLEEKFRGGLDTLSRSDSRLPLLRTVHRLPSHPSIVQSEGRTFWRMQGVWREVLETRPRPKLPASDLPRTFADDVPGLLDPRNPSLGPKPLINPNGFYSRRIPDGAQDCPVWAFRWRDLDPKEIEGLKF